MAESNEDEQSPEGIIPVHLMVSMFFQLLSLAGEGMKL